ncbi:MAG TPA: acyl-CoA dehydrogenase family protein [Dehalococcoidales bacterium]|nr:acyl-CoA dehydrogenase family protein [Dehalococcoidales bacterium]
MDFNLTEQEKMVRNLAADFAAKEVAPRAAEIDRSNAFPTALADEMRAKGFTGLPYPAKYGGGGAGYVSFVLALEQVCQASVSAGAIMSVNTVPQEGIYRFGTEEQKKRLLTPLASGKWLGGIGFTESETGSDPRALTTIARRKGDGFVINGQKMFMSLAPVLNVVLLFTRREGEGVNAFIVESAQKGFTVQEVLETMGMRGMGTSIVNLDDVYVPAENLLGKEGQGFEILLEAISVERMSVAVQAVAAAQSALDLAIAYAKERKAQGKPIAKMQAIQQMIAEMAAKTEAARWLTYRVAFLRDQGKNIQYESSMAKVFAAEVAVDVTRLAMQVHGSYGAVKSVPLERLYRDAKMTEIYVGISEVHRSIVANKLLQ